MNFHQVNAQQIGNLDMRSLAGELAILKDEMLEMANNSKPYTENRSKHKEAIRAVEHIAHAEAAARMGYATAVMHQLKNAGKWAFDVATKIGVSVAAEAIKKSIDYSA